MNLTKRRWLIDADGKLMPPPYDVVTVPADACCFVLPVFLEGKVVSRVFDGSGPMVMLGVWQEVSA